MMRNLAFIAITALMLTACGTYAAPDWTATPTVEATNLPTQTPSQPPTQTATFAPTVTPTTTPSATATDTPAATSTLQPTIAPTVASTAEPTDESLSLPSGEAATGEVLFLRGKDGSAPACVNCHPAAAAPFALGPVMSGISERAGARIEGVPAQSYLYRSIVQPADYVVPGFRPVMPSQYREHLTDKDIADIIAYLMTR